MSWSCSGGVLADEADDAHRISLVQLQRVAPAAGGDEPCELFNQVGWQDSVAVVHPERRLVERQVSDCRAAGSGSRNAPGQALPRPARKREIRPSELRRNSEIKIIQPERPWCLHRARFFAHAANCPNPQHWCPAATRVYGDLRSLLPTQRGTRSHAKQPSLCESRTDCSSFIPECEPGTLVPGASKRSGIDVEVIGELRDRR